MKDEDEIDSTVVFDDHSKDNFQNISQMYVLQLFIHYIAEKFSLNCVGYIYFF